MGTNSINNESKSTDLSGSTINKTRSTTTLLDFIYVLVRWKKLIILNFLFVTISTAIISLIIPKWYASTATIVLSKDSGSSFLGTLLGGEALNLFGGGLSSVDEKRQMAILSSRRLLESVISEFNLIEEYESATTEDAIETLKENLLFDYNYDLNTISVTAYYKEDSVTSAKIVNFTVEKLNEINIELATEQAKSERIFIEKRYYKNIVDLKEAEDKLNIFQKTHGIIELTEQTKVSIEAIAMLTGEVTSSEMEYNILKKSLGINNPNVLKVKAKIDELKFQMRKMSNQNSSLDIFLPFNQLSDIGLDYLRLFKEVQIQNKIQEFLIPQYEQAKIQESKDTPALLYLDKAVPPEKRDKPKRLIMVLISGVFSFFISILIIFAIEFWRVAREEKNNYYNMIIKIINEMKFI